MIGWLNIADWNVNIICPDIDAKNACEHQHRAHTHQSTAADQQVKYTKE